MFVLRTGVKKHLCATVTNRTQCRRLSKKKKEIYVIFLFRSDAYIVKVSFWDIGMNVSRFSHQIERKASQYRQTNLVQIAAQI